MGCRAAKRNAGWRHGDGVRLLPGVLRRCRRSWSRPDATSSSHIPQISNTCPVPSKSHSRLHGGVAVGKYFLRYFLLEWWKPGWTWLSASRTSMRDDVQYRILLNVVVKMGTRSGKIRCPPSASPVRGVIRADIFTPPACHYSIFLQGDAGCSRRSVCGLQTVAARGEKEN